MGFLLTEKLVYPEGELKEYKKIANLPLIKKLDRIIALKKTYTIASHDIEEYKEAMTISLIGCVSRFREAIERNNSSVVNLFLSADLNVNSELLAAKAGTQHIEFIRISPLSYAISVGADDIALLLLRSGAKLTVVHEDGKTALGYAVQKQNKTIISAMLKRHSINELEHIGKPPLLLAAAMGEGSISMVNFLLRQGANINSTYQQLKSKDIIITALSVAITCDDLALVHYLLMHNASMDHNGSHLAISQALLLGKERMLETIFALQPGYHFDYSNKYHPYYHLPENAELKKPCVHLLFKYKIITGDDLKDLLFRINTTRCIKRGDVTELVAQLSTNRQLLDQPECDSIRHYLATKLIKKSSTQKIIASDELLAQLVTKNGTSSIPYQVLQPSIIHTAIFYSNIPAFNLLLNHKANIATVDYWATNETHDPLLPIQLIAYCSQMDDAISILDSLMSRGIDINSVNSITGESALFTAVYQQRPGLIEYLIAQGADPCLKNKQGNTILFKAIERNIPIEVIRCLFKQAPCDISQLEDGVRLAATKGHRELTSLFIQHHLNVAHAGDLLDNPSFLTVIHELLAVGFSFHELMPFYKLGYDSTLKLLEKERHFYNHLSLFFIRNWKKINLSPSALVGVMMLSGLISIALGKDNSPFKSLSTYLEQFDLSNNLMISAPQQDLSLSKTLIALIQYYCSLLDGFNQELLKSTLPLAVKKEKLIEAIAFFDKQNAALLHLFTIFSLEPHQAINSSCATIYLLTEELEKTISLIKQDKKLKQSSKKQKDVAPKLLDPQRVESELQLETKRMAQDKRREEQSLRDRQRHLHSFSFYSPVAKKKNYSPLNTQSVTTVRLNPAIEQAFDLLQKIPMIQSNKKILYVVGSQVTQLLHPERTIDSIARVDLDMVLFIKPATIAAQLIELGFSPNKYINGLYTIRTATHRIDLMVQEKRTKVDFCGSQIFCDNEGNIYDVTGRGIKNLQDWTLETVLEASVCFEEDLVRILRAINFTLRGYAPNEAMQAALRLTYPATLIEEQKKALNACMRKYLYTVDNPQFVTLLIEYNLLQQLFGVEKQDNLNDAIMNLWANIIANLREECTTTASPSM